MGYIEDACDPLIRVIEHNAGLQVHQLAGHMANIDFWVDEVCHGLAVIDGYRQRFERLKSAQTEYEREHPHPISDPGGWVVEDGSDPPLKKGSKPSDRQRLRQQVLRAITRLIDRAEREKLVDPSRADDLRQRFVDGTTPTGDT